MNLGTQAANIISIYLYNIAYSNHKNNLRKPPMFKFFKVFVGVTIGYFQSDRFEPHHVKTAHFFGR